MAALAASARRNTLKAERGAKHWQGRSQPPGAARDRVGERKARKSLRAPRRMLHMVKPETWCEM